MAPPPPLTQSPSPALAGEAGGTLRPLAGFWFLNNKVQKIKRMFEVGFRPLAGFWFLNRQLMERYNIVKNLFPSPCGVLVLKSSPCEALWCLDKNAILRRGGVVGAKK